MGKFDGILLCTDLDDTLLTTDKRVSEENREAIEYFKSEGGLFTFATGRVPHGAKLMLEYVRPNAPMVCFNGGAIYDFEQDKLLWSRTLDKDAVEVVEYVDKMLEHAGIEICTADKIYFSKTNRIVEEHKVFERLPDNNLDYHDVEEEWVKVIFMVEEEQIPELRQLIGTSPFINSYSFTQSSPWYYELLPKDASKGDGLLQLASLLGIDKTRTIGVGDNENDMMLVSMAGVGIAVNNAVEQVKEVATYVMEEDHNSHAIAAVIRGIEEGKIKI